MPNLDVLLTKLVSAFLLPPLNVLMLLFGGVVLLKRHPRLGRAVIFGTCVVLYAASTPVLVSAVRRQFETIPPLDPSAALPPADAIVVLSGGVYRNAPEYGGDTISGHVLERLRYTARLYRLTGKPVLVSGGSWRAGVRPESQAIKESLEQDFHVPVRWLEDQSRNTQENARLSAALLHQQGIRKIYLVTHALHMPRAREAFERAGFQVTPAPTIFASRECLSVLHFLPHSSTLETSTILLHEWIGRVWYRWEVAIGVALLACPNTVRNKFAVVGQTPIESGLEPQTTNVVARLGFSSCLGRFCGKNVGWSRKWPKFPGQHWACPAVRVGGHG